MLKMIYLAKRKPGFSFDQFVRRWRMHGARGMEQAIWDKTLGYVQAEPIQPPPIEGATDEFDAVACFILADDAFSLANAEDARSMAEDELETFAAPIPSTAMWVEEDRVLAGELGGVSAFLFFEEEARARRVAEQARSAAGLNRITVNTRDDDGPLGPDANTLPYQAVLELSAPDVARLDTAVETGGRNLLAEADVSVVTREAVLWDRMPK